MKRKALLAVATAAVGLAVGCGGDDDEDGGGAGAGDTAQTTQQQAEPQATETEAAPAADLDDPAAVLQALNTALADGDADTACGLLTESATKQTEEASIGGSCEDWVEEITGVLDPESKDKMRNTTVTDTEISGEQATVTYISPVALAEIETEVELVQEDGAWKISKLVDFIGAPG